MNQTPNPDTQSRKTAKPRTVTRTCSFEVKLDCRKTDRKRLQNRLWGASDQLRHALNRSMTMMVGLYSGAFPWPEEPKKRGKDQGKAQRVAAQTLAYRLVTGNWSPTGEPCYTPGPAEVKKIVRGKDGAPVIDQKTGKPKWVVTDSVDATLGSAPLQHAANKLHTRIKTDWSDIAKGQKTAATWKSTPLGAPNKNVKLHPDRRIQLRIWPGYRVDPETGKRKRQNGWITVRPRKLDRWLRVILDRCISGEYKHGSAELIWKKPLNRKGRWMLHLSYTMPVAMPKGADPAVVAGVDIGVDHLAVLDVWDSNTASYGRPVFVPHPEPVMRALRRRQRELRQRRIHKRHGPGGKGYKKAVRGYLIAEDQISRAMGTMLQQAAAHIVSAAVKAGAGTLVLEDHKRWSVRKALEWGEDRTAKERARFRRSYLRWHAGGLHEAIKSAAEREGLIVISVNPAYTSRLCSSCGTIWHKAGIYAPKGREGAQRGKINRKAKQALAPGAGIMPVPEGTQPDEWGRISPRRFRCTCGYEGHADVNAARNIARRGAEAAESKKKG